MSGRRPENSVPLPLFFDLSESWSRRWLRASFLVLALSWVVLERGQVDPGVVRQLNNKLANEGATAIELFSAADTIATGNFHYDNRGPDDVDFSTYKIPIPFFPLRLGRPSPPFRFRGAFARFVDENES